jgi:hypothetical protein
MCVSASCSFSVASYSKAVELAKRQGESQLAGQLHGDWGDWLAGRGQMVAHPQNLIGL